MTGMIRIHEKLTDEQAAEYREKYLALLKEIGVTGRPLIITGKEMRFVRKRKFDVKQIRDVFFSFFAVRK